MSVSEYLAYRREDMSIKIDRKRGKLVAKSLYEYFYSVGIHGECDVPEDEPPKNVIIGSLEHILFLTFTVAIDYQRDAHKLWQNARKTFEDPYTAYLFNPKSLHKTPFESIVLDMQRYGLSKKPTRDAQIWKRVGTTLCTKWSGDPRNFIKDCGWDCPTILNRLKNDTHILNGSGVPDYPFLRGDKLGPLWVKVLRDSAGLDRLHNLRYVPIPVDIHVARATLSLGVVHGKFSGRLTDLFSYIRAAWFESVCGLFVKDRDMIALDADEPLWHLSKYGCSYRDASTGICRRKSSCETSNFCTNGQIRIEAGMVDMNL
jgi:hypothetical protein